MSFPNKNGKKGTNNNNTQQVRPQQQGAPAQANPPRQGNQPSNDPPLTEKGMKTILGEFRQQLESSFGGKLSDHESRITKLEQAVGLKKASGPDPTTTAPDPANATASGGNTAPAPAPAPAATSPTTTQPALKGNTPCNGPGHVYKYWNWQKGKWQFTTDLWAANQAGNGVFDILWGWYQNGVLDHILSDEEIEQYCP